jgi:D-lactate dehydrogenase (cytochrome)
MDLVDLFVGSEGTLGVIVEATLDVLRWPRRVVALLPCSGDGQALAVTAALRAAAGDASARGGPLDVAAIEYMDERSLLAAGKDALARAGVTPPAPGGVLLLVQIETSADDEGTLSAFADVLDRCGVREDPQVAAPGDDRGAQRLFDLREAVPAGVNQRIAAAQRFVHPGIEKTAGDMIVPFARLADSLEVYRQTFERRELDYAIWGHVSDGNLHPNVVPRSFADVERGRAAILEIARAVIAMGGAPLAEHGVGRSALKQRLLRELYGDAGVAQMRAVKRALDPAGKLAPGVLFSDSAGG